MMIIARRGHLPTVSIRARPNGNRGIVSFNSSLVRELGLTRGQPVVMFLDCRLLKFKLRPTRKEAAGVAYKLIKDGRNESALNIYTPKLDPKKFAPGKYDPIITDGWVSIDLNAPRKRVLK